MTDPLFRDDAYARDCEAVVLAVNERGGVILDRTVFYPTGGGQPGDSGALTAADGAVCRVATAAKGEGAEIIHVPAEGETPPAPGTRLTAAIDWERRYAHMRMHTAMHLLSAALPFPVTGGQVGAEKSRLDFDLPEPPDKEAVAAAVNEMIAEDIEVGAEWISDADLAANPDLVKTMSVKPPMGAGRVRLIRVGARDLQPCGGTHVARTGEIGAIAVAKIEKKGKQNRRVVLTFA